MWHNRETYAEAVQLAEEIAKHLDGYKVEIKTFDNGGQAINLVKDGIFDLLLNQAYNEPNRVRIHGLLPDNPHRDHLGVEGGTITVSMTRSGKAIAGDITRRLLPDYESAVETALLKIAEADKHRQALATLIDDLAARIPGSRKGGEGDRQRVDLPYRERGTGYWYGDIDITSGGTAHIKITTDNIAFLRDLADLIAKHQR
ncbi:hypothetical protein ACWDTT_15900 [Streptosporangium sandarakinum]